MPPFSKGSRFCNIRIGSASNSFFHCTYAIPNSQYLHTCNRYIKDNTGISNKGSGSSRAFCIGVGVLSIAVSILAIAHPIVMKFNKNKFQLGIIARQYALNPVISLTHHRVLCEPGEIYLSGSYLLYYMYWITTQLVCPAVFFISLYLISRHLCKKADYMKESIITTDKD